MPGQRGEGGYVPPVGHLRGCEHSYHPKNPGLETPQSPGRRSPLLWEEMILWRPPALIPLPHYCHPPMIALQRGPDWGITQPQHRSGRTLCLSPEPLCSLQPSGEQ